MKITKIKGSDFLILKEVELSPDSRLNKLVGRNRNGKTSLLKLIKAGLKGADASVIRTGADKSEILINIDELKVHRTIRAKGANTLEVTSPMTLPGGEVKDMPIPSPQAYLDTLLSDFSFDPIQFILLEGKERTKSLRDLFKTKVTLEHLSFVDEEVMKMLDLGKDGMDVLSDAEKIYYTKRTDVNKIVSQKKALYEEAKARVNGFDPASFVNRTEELSASIRKVEQELTEAQAEQKHVESNKRLRERTEEKIQAAKAGKQTWDNIIAQTMPRAKIEVKRDEIAAEITKLQGMLNELTRALGVLDEAEKRSSELGNDIESLEKDLNALPSISDIPEIAPLEEQLDDLTAELERNNIEVEAYDNYLRAEALRTEYEGYKSASDLFTEKIDKLRKDVPQQLTKEANIPIANLRFDGDKVFIGEKSIDNLSTSEQVEIAVQIVEAFNRDKPLKILCVDRFESLDQETAAAFEKALPKDYTLFVTMVEHEGMKVHAGDYRADQGNISQIKEDGVIEDGEVKSEMVSV